MNIAEKIEQRGGVAATITQVDIGDEDAADPMTRRVGGAHARRLHSAYDEEMTLGLIY
jgi:hypothetical protein